MKNIVNILIITVLWALPIGAAGQDLVILHTNDTHSQIEPFQSGEWQGFAGVARREKYIRQVRREMPNVLLLDAGDFSQGTPYFTLFRGEVEIKLMNALKVDAACWGNHEFDNGPKELSERAKVAKFPIVCTNFDISESALNGVIKPYTILRKAGKRIGIIGACTRLGSLVSPKNLEGIKYIHPYKVLTQTALMLKNEKKCDLVILLSHCGYYGGSQNNPDDCMIAAATEGIDIIIGGHTHTFIKKPAVIANKAGDKVYVVQAGEKGVDVGRLNIWF